MGLAVVGQIHNGFRAHLHRHFDLVHFQLVVLRVAGNAEIHIDLGAQPVADTLGGQRGVVHIGGDGNGAGGHPLAHPFGCAVFFFRHRGDLGSDDAVLGGIHLRFVHHTTPSFS